MPFTSPQPVWGCLGNRDRISTATRQSGCVTNKKIMPDSTMDRLMTIARNTLVFTATPLLLWCGGNTGIRQGEPVQQAHNEPIVCPPEPEPPVEPEQKLEPNLYSVLEPPEVAALPRCSPVPKEIERWGGGCTPSEQNTVCHHLNGRVYLWNPSKNCKKPGFRDSAEGDNDCYDTSIPRGPTIRIARNLATSRYCREKPDGWIEILMLGSSSYSDSSLRRLGWTKEDCQSICPEAGECRYSAANIYHAPDCR